MALGKRKLAARGLALSGLGALLRRLSSWNGLLALAYHRLGDGRNSLLDRSLWSATADDFHRQVAFLKKHFDVIGPPEIAEALRRRRGRYVLLTFDDGYRDNYEIALPILTTHGVTGTFFVCTAFVDEGLVPWWDEIAWMVRTSRRPGICGGPWLAAPLGFDEPNRERAVQTLLDSYRLLPWERTQSFLTFLAEETGSGRCVPCAEGSPWMTWEMLRVLRDAGMIVGGHAAHHRVLAHLPKNEQEQEICLCGRRLEAELGTPMRYFSYPEGHPRAFNGVTRGLLKEYGLEYAFSYYGRYRSFGDCKARVGDHDDARVGDHDDARVGDHDDARVGDHDEARVGKWDPYDVPRVAVETDVSLELFRAVLTLPRIFA